MDIYYCWANKVLHAEFQLRNQAHSNGAAHEMIIRPGNSTAFIVIYSALVMIVFLSNLICISFPK